MCRSKADFKKEETGRRHIKCIVMITQLGLISTTSGNFKQQIVKGRVSFRILTLRITMHGHLIGA